MDLIEIYLHVCSILFVNTKRVERTTNCGQKLRLYVAFSARKYETVNMDWTSHRKNIVEEVDEMPKKNGDIISGEATILCPIQQFGILIINILIIVILL